MLLQILKDNWNRFLTIILYTSQGKVRWGDWLIENNNYEPINRTR